MPEVIAIDLDESCGMCETLTSRDVRNETLRKRPRRDFADEEREKLLEFNSSCPVVDDNSVTRKIDCIDVIHIDVHETPRPNSSSTRSSHPIGQMKIQDSSVKVNFASSLAVTGTESRKRLEIDATQLHQGDSDILPAVDSPSSDINKNAPSNQNCPKEDTVHNSSEDEASSFRGEAYGPLPNKVRLNDISFYFNFFPKKCHVAHLREGKLLRGITNYLMIFG